MLKEASLATVLVLGTACLCSAQVPRGIVSCYFSSWAFYRPDNGKFDVDNIDPNLCTHGYYAFSDMNNQTWEIEAIDPWYDLDASDPDCVGGAAYCNYGSFKRFTALKNQNPQFHPMLSIGGWNAGSEKYSVMAADPAKRSTFIQSCVRMATTYGFDGIDFDWEYPGVREGSNAEEDKQNYDLLVQELAAALHAEGLLFTAALGCGFDKIEIGYDMPFLVQHYDFLNIMGYDFHGAFENFTGHNSPLYPRDEELVEGHPGYKYNIYECVQEYLNRQTPPESMVIGLPTYGRGFEVEDINNMGLYCDAYEGNPMGPYTRQRGIMGYNEILELRNADQLPGNYPEATPHAWVDVRDTCYQAPYMTNGPYWIGYDDPNSIALKVRYANLEGLAGAMVWSLETDDFLGLNSEQPYPLLRRIIQELANGQTFDPVDDNCGTAPICSIELNPFS